MVDGDYLWPKNDGGYDSEELNAIEFFSSMNRINQP
jgi:hypothetical protein